MEDFLGYFEQYVDARRQEISTLRKRLEVLERDQPLLEQVYCIFAEDFEQRTQRAVQQQRRTSLREASQEEQTLSLRLAIIEILKSAGGPLHLNAIHEALISRGYTSSKMVVRTTCNKAAGREHFLRVAPNTYALRPE